MNKDYLKFGCPKCSMEPVYGYAIVEDEINIDSCCGGGCFAASDIAYCPYCGFKFNKEE